MPTEDLQLSFGGLTVGNGTVYGIRRITGLRDFTARFVDDSTATRWGTLVGGDMVEPASVVVEFQFRNDPAAIAALEAAFLPSEQTSPATLGELAWKWPDEQELMRQARCRRRSRPIDVRSERVGVGAVSVFVELQAPDPRCYSAALHQEAVSPFGDDLLTTDLTAGSGADLGLNLTVGSGASLGWDFSGTSGGGTVFVLNDGNTTTWPQVTFSAPSGMTRWRLWNLTTDEVAEFSFVLGAGQQMIVDFAARATPKSGDVVTVDGAARYAAWAHPRLPLALPAGNNELRFDVLEGDETAATAVVEYRDAYL